MAGPVTLLPATVALLPATATIALRGPILPARRVILLAPLTIMRCHPLVHLRLQLRDLPA